MALRQPRRKLHPVLGRGADRSVDDCNRSSGIGLHRSRSTERLNPRPETGQTERVRIGRSPSQSDMIQLDILHDHTLDLSRVGLNHPNREEPATDGLADRFTPIQPRHQPTDHRIVRVEHRSEPEPVARLTICPRLHHISPLDLRPGGATDHLIPLHRPRPVVVPRQEWHPAPHLLRHASQSVERHLGAMRINRGG